jgi:hypothetical protein
MADERERRVGFNVFFIGRLKKFCCCCEKLMRGK